MKRREALTLLGQTVGWSLLSPWLLAQNSAPAALLTRPIPVSGEQLPVVGLGTWQTFDVGPSVEERSTRQEVLRLFHELGGRVIDSSPMYGRSEQVVGDLAQALAIRPGLFMATKVWTSGGQQGIDQMNRSFQRMGVSVMDLMQVHNLLDWRTHWPTLRAWKEQGRLRYIGFTHYHHSAYANLIRLIKNEKPDFVQFNYNIVAREAEKELLPTARDHGVAVLVNRPYQGGQLFRLVQGKTLPDWAAEYNISSWGQFFLKFIISHPAVTCPIPGTSKPHHLQDNMGAAFGPLPDDKTRQKMAAVINT